MENSVINVKQTVIYNTGRELYVILQLISCCCWTNFIDFNLQDKPSKDTIITFKCTAKSEIFFLTNLLDQVIFQSVSQFQFPEFI